jgi:hypothetical protein
VTEIRLTELSFEPVRIDGFPVDTHAWIRRLVGELDGSDPGVYASLDTASLLVFIMRALPEDEVPGGKWATIQHLEDQIQHEVAVALARAGVPLRAEYAARLEGRKQR